MTTQPTNEEAPKKKRAPAKPKQAPAAAVKSQVNEETKVGEPKNTNDGIFHLPMITVLIVLAIGFTQLINQGMNAGKTEQELQKVETQFNGYKEGVKDSN